MSTCLKFAVATLAVVGTSLLGATPAMAADLPEVGASVGSTEVDTNSLFGPGVNAANNWNFTAADVCIQELAVVPALSAWTGNHHNNCSNGNVIDHSGGSGGH